MGRMTARLMDRFVMSNYEGKAGKVNGKTADATESRQALEFDCVPLSAVCACSECGSAMSTRAEFVGYGAPDVRGPVCLDCGQRFVSEITGDGE